MVRRERDADRGVGGQLMAKAIERRPDCGEHLRREARDVVGRLHRDLDNRELVAREARDEIALADAAPEAARHPTQQFVAYLVTQRVIDALELVDIDVVHREPPAGLDIGKLLLQPLVEQSAVGQVGQRIVMGEVGDLLLGAAALSDVFMGGEPTAVGERLVDDLYRAAVGDLDDADLPPVDLA
jgi:hypothetical protein